MTDHFVYVIGFADKPEDRPVKIGVSSSPWDRLRTLQQGNPKQLVILAAFPFATRAEALRREREYHEAMSTTRACSEWFNDDYREAIDAFVWENKGYFSGSSEPFVLYEAAESYVAWKDAQP